MGEQPRHLYEFGPFRLDTRERLLTCKDRPVALTAKAFEALLILVTERRAPGHQRRFAETALAGYLRGRRNLAKHVSLLRKALAQGESGIDFIVTVPKIGYRFVAGVTEASDAPLAADAAAPPAPAASALHHSRRRAILLTAALVLLGGLLLAYRLGWIHRSLRKTQLSIRSIAVLPLENVSGDPTQEYFDDGMTDQLITDLGKIGELRVVSRTSAMQYKGVHKPLPQIGRELNVDAVVEGAVHRSGNRMRITAQLVQAPADKHLWADSYEDDAKMC